MIRAAWFVGRRVSQKEGSIQKRQQQQWWRQPENGYFTTRHPLVFFNNKNNIQQGQSITSFHANALLLFSVATTFSFFYQFDKPSSSPQVATGAIKTTNDETNQTTDTIILKAFPYCPKARRWNNRLSSSLSSLVSNIVIAPVVTQCESKSTVNNTQPAVDDVNNEVDSPYPESEEFRASLEFYRQQLPWYRKNWSMQQTPISANWPRNIPTAEEIPGLELDLKFCKRNPGTKDNVRKCQDKQFKIASYYLQQPNQQQQMIGYKLVKELADQGHPDGMCLYGKVLMNGTVTGIDANPEEAVVWWRRCADLHKHIPSTYELAVALYMGDGVAENPELAVKLFRRAANVHVGAAYMLGECLLDGVGVTRHRAAALEWLIVAAELGHRGAQARALAILEGQGEYAEGWEDYDDESIEDDERLSSDKNSSPKSPRRSKINIERRFTIGGGANLERRFTIGGGSQNPAIRKRRNTIVQESRDDGLG